VCGGVVIGQVIRTCTPIELARTLLSDTHSHPCRPGPHIRTSAAPFPPFSTTSACLVADDNAVASHHGVACYWTRCVCVRTPNQNVLAKNSHVSAKHMRRSIVRHVCSNTDAVRRHCMGHCMYACIPSLTHSACLFVCLFSCWHVCSQTDHNDATWATCSRTAECTELCQVAQQRN